MIEVVVVDLGGVAARYRPERRLAALSSLSGVAPEVLQARLFDSGLEHRAELGELEPSEVQRDVVRALEGRVSFETLIEAWALAFELKEDVLECLAGLQLRKALFTNNGPMLDACLAGPLHRLHDVFEEVICSWHLKARKPETDAYTRAAGRIGGAPDQLLLLDDSEANVRAAIQCGWASERVTNTAEVSAAIARTARGW